LWTHRQVAQVGVDGEVEFFEGLDQLYGSEQTLQQAIGLIILVL